MARHMYVNRAHHLSLAKNKVFWLVIRDELDLRTFFNVGGYVKVYTLLHVRMFVY